MGRWLVVGQGGAPAQPVAGTDARPRRRVSAVAVEDAALGEAREAVFDGAGPHLAHPFHVVEIVDGGAHEPADASGTVPSQCGGGVVLGVVRLTDSQGRSVDFRNCVLIMRATIDDLDDVEGVGEVRARAIKDGLSRLTESSILDRYS